MRGRRRFRGPLALLCLLGLGLAPLALAAAAAQPDAVAAVPAPLSSEQPQPTQAEAHAQQQNIPHTTAPPSHDPPAPAADGAAAAGHVDAAAGTPAGAAPPLPHVLPAQLQADMEAKGESKRDKQPDNEPADQIAARSDDASAESLKRALDAGALRALPPHASSAEADAAVLARVGATVARSRPYSHAGHVHLTDPATTIIQHGDHTHTLEDAERHGGLIFTTLLLSMVGAQLLLVLWKKYSPNSFDMATLAGLWLFPMLYSLFHGPLQYARMLLLWLAFTAASAFVVRKALSKPVERTTPRLVYSFFYGAYRISYATAGVGYLILMMHFLGAALLLPSFLMPSPPTALLLCFYGLYFGVLGRDLANVCSFTMAVNMGYVARKGEIPAKSVPANVCAICDGELVRSFRPTAAGTPAEPDERIFQLSCHHQFHESCLRGWTMIGKRDTCACCNEKARLAQTLKQPWESTSVAWAWLLDVIRYLIVFNPIIILAAQGILYLVY